MPLTPCTAKDLITNLNMGIHFYCGCTIVVVVVVIVVVKMVISIHGEVVQFYAKKSTRIPSPKESITVSSHSPQSNIHTYKFAKICQIIMAHTYIHKYTSDLCIGSLPVLKNPI